MDLVLQRMRDAVGAVAVGPPAAFWLRRRGRDWAVRREGEAVETLYPTEAEARTAIRIALLRCSAYCVLMQADDGWYVLDSSNWPGGDSEQDPPAETAAHAALRR
ncbi:MAG TPA: hypothetical protein VHA35_21530 [Dongiaceae bacterium]|nr:hypothetical protein [Dongiaceae bacterium]